MRIHPTTDLPRTRPLAQRERPVDACDPGDWIAVTIPMQPPAEVSPNARVHWRSSARAKQALFETTKLAVVSMRNAITPGAIFPPATPLDLLLTIGWGRGRKRQDHDNAIASVKAAIDGLAAALEIDDRYFRVADLDQVRDVDGRGWLHIRAERQDQENAA